MAFCFRILRHILLEIIVLQDLVYAGYIYGIRFQYLLSTLKIVDLNQ